MTAETATNLNKIDKIEVGSLSIAPCRTTVEDPGKMTNSKIMPSSESARAKGFEEIEHTADWAYRVRGENLAQLFIQAASGLYALVGMQLAPGERITRSLQLKAIDRESLLVAWLNELLYLHESEGLGFERLEIQHLDGESIQAQVTGAPTQQWLKDIKAVTYHNLAIRETESGLEVTLVLDV